MPTIRTMADISTAIKYLRRQAKLSQEELASFAGLSRTAIQHLEEGKETIKLSTLLKTLAVLNTKMALEHPLLQKQDPSA